MIERILLRMRELKNVAADMVFFLGVVVVATVAVMGFWYVMLKIS